jgi:hypothetical protein
VVVAAYDRRGSARWIAPAGILCVYVLLLAITASVDPGDTRDYANSITERFAGKDLYFWESGHLLWRPLGFLLVLVAHPVHAGSSSMASYADVVHALSAISIAAGAVALLALFAFQRRMGVRALPAAVATTALALTCAFLDYAQSGTAYIPALAMLIVALWALAVDDPSRWRGLVPGVALAASVLLWLPMMFVVPIIALSPLILRGDDRRRRVTAFAVCVLSGALVVAAYVSVAAIKQIHSIAAFRAWIAEATHGIRDSGGVSRAAIGFARSVSSTKDLGLTAKRHLLGDPYAPATMADVLRAGLYRVVIFYAALGALVLWLALRRQWRVLGYLAVTAVPVLGMAIAWQGGDLERYLALFPALFLAVGVALSSMPRRWGVLCTAVMIAMFGAFNLPDYSRATVARTCDALTGRLLAVSAEPGRKKLLVTMTVDELTAMRGRCPDARVLDRPDLPAVYGVFAPHVSEAAQWRRSFADRAQSQWESGGSVWISKGLLQPAPPAAWHWAEGDDNRVRWRDFPVFFHLFTFGGLGKGANSFVEIVESPRNIAILDSARRTAR